MPLPLSCAIANSAGGGYERSSTARAGQPGGRRQPRPASRQRRSTRRSRSTSTRLNFYYGPKRALDGISIQIRANLVTAFIGPSGCGKSTFLRTLNRMNDIIPMTRVEGKVLIDGESIYDAGRRRRPAAPQGRHGVPEVEPVPQVDFRERRLRPAHQRPGEVEGRDGRPRRGKPAAGGDLGRGQGPAARVGAGAVGRPAAAAVHRAGAGHPAGDPADGRAGLGARPDRHAAHRRADLRAQEAVHHRDRHA